MYNSWGIISTCQCQQMARSSADQNPFREFPRLFREFPRLFRKFPRLFREFPVCFWRDCVQKMERSDSPINTAAKPYHRLLKAFNHPTNSRWVQATMPHYKILWWGVSWSSDTCGISGANDSFPLSLSKSYLFPRFMTAQTAEQANNAQRTLNMKIFKQRLCLWKCIQKSIWLKKPGFPNKYKNYLYLWLPRVYIYID